VEIVPMDFTKGEWSRPEYLAKNPMGKVPTLEDDGYVLWESPAILFHVASKYPERRLAPTDTLGITEMLPWFCWNAGHLDASVFAVALEKMFKPMRNQPIDNARVESSTKEWERFAPVLNAHLEGKEWILGNFSIVDIAFGPTIELAGACGLGV